MLRRILPPTLALLLLAGRPGATWSIVCVNQKTREVGVATATCIPSFNIRTGVPVIYVGEGAAAAQSSLDAFGNNRRRIFNTFRDTENTPAQILADLAAHDNNHQSRQYGIANFTGAPVTFTGTGDGRAASGVTGVIGDFAYSIQGNVLVGDEVVLAAEQAFRGMNGDMGQRLMAAMEAARALGGDGRCSCNPTQPTSCGVPPPGFVKSAHAGTVLVARPGDPNGACDEVNGCAQGNYYMQLNVRGNFSNPDPVLVLEERYKAFRLGHVGRPDGLTSTGAGPRSLPIDGVTERTVTVELHDIDGASILHGGAALEIETVDGGASLIDVGPVADLGDGRYTFTLRAGLDAGVDRFFVRVFDPNPADPLDVVTATLYPPLEVTSVDVALFAGEESVSAAAGGNVPFVVNRPDRPFAPYMLFARLAAGQRRVGGGGGGQARIPIVQRPFSPAGPLPLDANGRGQAELKVPPGLLLALVGRSIEVTGAVFGTPVESTNTVSVGVTP